VLRRRAVRGAEERTMYYRYSLPGLVVIILLVLLLLYLLGAI
jgi:hypothetical protein